MLDACYTSDVRVRFSGKPAPAKKEPLAIRAFAPPCDGRRLTPPGSPDHPLFRGAASGVLLRRSPRLSCSPAWPYAGRAAASPISGAARPGVWGCPPVFHSSGERSEPGSPSTDAPSVAAQGERMVWAPMACCSGRTDEGDGTVVTVLKSRPPRETGLRRNIIPASHPALIATLPEVRRVQVFSFIAACVRACVRLSSRACARQRRGCPRLRDDRWLVHRATLHPQR